MSLVPEPSAYVGMDDYTSMNSYLNKSVYARSLPPIPENCPLPMGVVGKDNVYMKVWEIYTEAAHMGNDY